MEPGQEMMIWCEGGRATIKREIYPPRPEIRADGGLYVLVDEGEPADWKYHFVPDGF